MAFAWTGVNSFHPARLMPSCNLAGRSVMDASGKFWFLHSGFFWCIQILINTQGFLSPSFKKHNFLS